MNLCLELVADVCSYIQGFLAALTRLLNCVLYFDEYLSVLVLYFEVFELLSVT